MAEGKKSVLLYCDLIHTIEKMDNETAGKFFKHYLRYINDLDPKTEDLVVDLTFESVKQNLKRDLHKWEEKKNKYSEAGMISAKSKRLQKGSQLYVLSVKNNYETFIKVGITDASVSRRFSSKDTFKGTDYKFDVQEQFFMENPLDLEIEIENHFKHKQYRPTNKFSGHMECYSSDCLNDIIHFATKFNDVQQRSTKSTVTVNDNVTVTDNVNVSTYVDEDKIDKIFLQFREKYKTYNAQLLTDGIFINSISREFFNTHDKNIQKETLRKYLKEYLNRLDQDKKVHNNKKQFMEHFPNWLRKQEIKLVIPKQEKQRYV